MSPRTIPDAEIDAWAARYQDGETIHAIAAIFDRSTQTIHRYLKERGVKLRSRGWAARTENGRDWKGGRPKGSGKGMPLSPEHRAAIARGQQRRRHGEEI